MPDYNTYELPICDVHRGRGQVLYEKYQLPTFNNNNSNSNDSMLVLWGYLSEIWLKTCYPVSATESQSRFGVMGEGLIDMAQLTTGSQCSAATIDIVEVPPSSDVIFGEPSLVYAGMCGFATTPSGNLIIQTGEHRFDIQVTVGLERYGKAHFINHTNTSWFPESPTMNAFWYKLKPGFVANIVVQGQDNGRGASLDSLINNRFQPMAGGFNSYDPPRQPP